MMSSPSWVELHGALTHFPIVLLLITAAFEFGAALPRQPEARRAAWRATSLGLLLLAVLFSIPSLLSGYFVGRTFARPPMQFQNHWIAAVTASVLALVLLVWRLAARDQLSRAAHAASSGLLLCGVAAISYTGYLGGQMVFGDESAAPEPVPTLASAPAPDSLTNEKIGVAAGKMEVAAGKLDVATDKFALAARSREQAAAPVPVPTPQTIIKTVPAPPVPTAPPAKPDDTSAKMERVASRFEQTAAKLEHLAAALQAKSQSSGQYVPIPSGAKPGTSQPAKIQGGSKASPNHVKTTATATAPPSGLAPKLIAQGEAVFRSHDSGCLNCHKLNGVGGRGGPDLTGEGNRQPDPAWQLAHLKDPPSKVPGSTMPPYDDMPDANLRALAAFLATRR